MSKNTLALCLVSLNKHTFPMIDYLVTWNPDSSALLSGMILPALRSFCQHRSASANTVHCETIRTTYTYGTQGCASFRSRPGYLVGMDPPHKQHKAQTTKHGALSASLSEDMGEVGELVSPGKVCESPLTASSLSSKVGHSFCSFVRS